jgi:hypothetical protein
VVFEGAVRYGPAIKWHGNNIAEIHIPTGSPFSHSYFFNFNDRKLSERYDFPVYFDIFNNVVLVWGNQDFELYDIKTNELIREYNLRRNKDMTAFWPYIWGYFEKETDDVILLYYRDKLKNETGKFIIDISRKINGT